MEFVFVSPAVPLARYGCMLILNTPSPELASLVLQNPIKIPGNGQAQRVPSRHHSGNHTTTTTSNGSAHQAALDTCENERDAPHAD